MSYLIKQWITTKDYTCEDVGKARTAEDAIKVAKELARIFDFLIDEDVKKYVHTMPEGDTLKITVHNLDYEMHIMRTKS